MAIGITPPSLDILAGLDLDRMFIARGIRVNTAKVWENCEPVFALNFGGEDAYPFILTLPQSETVQLLRENLIQYPSVTLLHHQEVQQVIQNASGVRLTARNAATGAAHTWVTAFAVACDGAHSRVREMLGFETRDHSYAPVFSMADFHDRSGLGDDAHLFFGRERPVESFPLPGGKRRWIVRSGWKGAADLNESIVAAVTRLTGIVLDECDQLDQSSFRPAWKLADRYYRDRVILCGDAAHVMSPIGGQGMNTGFADAAFLARAFEEMLAGRGPASAWLGMYDRERRRAFRVAAARAAAGMALGVARGPVMSRLRGLMLLTLMDLRGPQHFLARWFTMRSLPAVQRQYDGAARHIKGAIRTA